MLKEPPRTHQIQVEFSGKYVTWICGKTTRCHFISFLLSELSALICRHKIICAGLDDRAAKALVHWLLIFPWSNLLYFSP